MNAIAQHFAKLGARAKVRQGSRLELNVLNDKEGEYFDIQVADAELAVLNIDKPGRHLLIQTRQPGGSGEAVKGGERFTTQKFLCGHDERHWFVATVDNGAGTVARAKLTLKPRVVRDEEASKGVSRGKRNRRHNKASRRQGEWFFLPQPGFKPQKNAIILKNEPFTRAGGGKPHRAELAYRFGGESVWVCSQYPDGITDKMYLKLQRENPEDFKNNVWRNMRRNAAMYVKGKISHPDHKTLELGDWCLVEMNTERRSGNVAFLD